MSQLNEKLKVEQQNALEKAQKAAGIIPGSDTASIPELTDDMVVKTKDGKEVSLKELKEGFMMREDYSRKTAELADEKKQIEKDLVDASQYIGTTQDYFKKNDKAYQAFKAWATNPDGSTPPVEDKSKPGEPAKTPTPPEDKLKSGRTVQDDNMIAKVQKEMEDMKLREKKREDEQTITQFKTEKKLEDEQMQAVIDLANGNYDHNKNAYDNLTIAYNVLNNILDKNKQKLEDNVREKLGANFLGGTGIVRANSKTQDQKVNDTLFGKDKNPGGSNFL